MKLIKLSVISAAVLGTTAAMAVQPPASTVSTVNAPQYQYNPDAGIIRNTSGAVVDTTRTLFQTATHPAAVSAEIGTLGYGANVAWGLNESTELQAGWSGGKHNDTIKLNTDDSVVDWDKALGEGYNDFQGNLAYDVKVSNPYIGVQLRPMKNWLTVGAGVMVPRNSLKATLTPTNDSRATVKIDGIEYKIENGSTVYIEAENKNSLAPYATIGLRPNITNRWGAFAEVGAAYMGGYDADVKVTRGAVTSTDPRVTNGIANATQDFEKRAENEISNNDIKWWPVAKLGLTYRF